jgi:hypothetical protein
MVYTGSAYACRTSSLGQANIAKDISHRVVNRELSKLIEKEETKDDTQETDQDSECHDGRSQKATGKHAYVDRGQDKMSFTSVHRV